MVRGDSPPRQVCAAVRGDSPGCPNCHSLLSTDKNHSSSSNAPGRITSSATATDTTNSEDAAASISHGRGQSVRQIFPMTGQWTGPGGSLPLVARSGRNIVRSIMKADGKKAPRYIYSPSSLGVIPGGPATVPTAREQSPVPHPARVAVDPA